MLRKRLKALCAFLVVAGEHAGPAAAIHEESHGLLEARRDEQGVRYAMKKLDRGSILQLRLTPGIRALCPVSLTRFRAY